MRFVSMRPRAPAALRHFLRCIAATLLLNCPASAVTIDMVPVGNAGNANDPATGNVYGGVAYDYQIAKYDVTIGQYTEFLNAVDPTGGNAYGLFNPSMASNHNIAGITFTEGASDGSKYAVSTVTGNSSNRPITYVSWFDAARFANWVHNGQGSGDTETGAYTLSGATSGTAPAANPGATIRLPTLNEWYKAAFFSPDYGGPGTPGYFDYATQSDTAPGNVVGSLSNQANYKLGGKYSVTQDSNLRTSDNYLSDVGAFTNSASYYGTFDQTGNVYQWTDLNGGATASALPQRGGSWHDTGGSFVVSSSYAPANQSTDYENFTTGFRLVSPVPEPSTFILTAGAMFWGAWLIKRRR